MPKQGEIVRRPAWPEDTVFRRLALDVERRLLRALRRQVKAVLAAEGIGLQIAPVIDQEPLGPVGRRNLAQSSDYNLGASGVMR